MKNDKLKVGDAVLYRNYYTKFGIVKRITKKYVIVERVIHHNLQHMQYMKKDDVKKIPKMYIKVSNAKMEEIKKRCNDCLCKFFVFKKTKQINKLCHTKDKQVAVIFYFTKEEKKYFCVLSSSDICIEEEFVILFL